jgi:deazaflavin-dependent oxidoreductase (nitroreductase family)
VTKTATPFQKPTFVERIFNASVGALLRSGIGLSHMRLLEVRGRKTGRLYTMPVDLLTFDGRLFLVGARGHTQWSRNAAAAGTVVLRRGADARKYALRALADAEKPPILAAYLDRFRREVARFFPVPPGSGPDAFTALAPRYPAFELVQRS